MDMYSGADPGLIAYLKQMQETEPGLTLTGLGQATVPRPFQELAGIAKPLNSFSRDFPEMREYENRARAVWESPSIRVGEQVISPADYYLLQIKASLGSEEMDFGSAERFFKEKGLGDLIGGGSLNDALQDTLDTGEAAPSLGPAEAAAGSATAVASETVGAGVAAGAAS
jgi:hypothetical protein